MPKMMVRGRIRSAVVHNAEARHQAGSHGWVRFADCMRACLSFGRRIRIFSNKDNAVPFALGGVLDVMLGNNSAVQKVAKIVFGSLSILRCTEDLVELKRLGAKFRRCFSGREYVPIKGDSWERRKLRGCATPSTDDMKLWSKTGRRAQLKILFQTIAEIFKRFWLLVLHLADVYSAYTENTVAEVFVHGKDLWKMLTSDESILYKELQNTEKVNDHMLSSLGSPVHTKILMTVFKIHNVCKKGVEAVKTAAKKTCSVFKMIMAAIAKARDELKACYIQTLKDCGILYLLPKFFIPKLDRPYFMVKDGENDLDARFVPAPQYVHYLKKA